jgi:hypothetical protein
MKRITEEELRNYFEQIGHVLVNKNKVKISGGKTGFSLEYLLEETDEDRFEKYELYDEVNDVKNFIEAYNIGSIEDLKLISRAQIWIRYLQEKAEVIFTNGDDNSVHFRLFRGKTTVYSWQLEWYKEVYKVLNMTEHFKEFVNEHWDVIEEMSYKR